MEQVGAIREGMSVVGPGGGLGTVERVHGEGFDANGRHYDNALVARVADGRIYVRGTGVAEGAVLTATTAGAAGEARSEERAYGAVEEGELRVPIVEERLAVGTREVELGEVAIRKAVETEEQTVPVTLTHEEVHIERRTVAERPATGADLFAETTIRMRLRGEEAVVAKEAIVTGEVVIEKETVAEERQITDTVRKQRVEVEEAYREARSGFQQAHTTRSGGTGRTFEQAEPHYRSGFAAGHDERYSGQSFEQAEPALRREYESGTAGRAGGDTWEQLRHELREGWDRARGR